jgi:hypothetical protein
MMSWQQRKSSGGLRARQCRRSFENCEFLRGVKEIDQMDIKERKTDIMETPTQWYRRRFDPERSCKTGEVVEPALKTWVQKLRFIVVGGVMGGLVFTGQKLFFVPWLHARTDAIAMLGRHDPVATALQAAQLNTWLLLGPVATGAGAVTWVVPLVLRALRSGRWPLPGAKVARRTEVVSGWCLYLRCALILVLMLPCMLVSWMSYVELNKMFWNGYLDKKIAASLKPQRPARAPAQNHW